MSVFNKELLTYLRYKKVIFKIQLHAFMAYSYAIAYMQYRIGSLNCGYNNRGIWGDDLVVTPGISRGYFPHHTKSPRERSGKM